MNYTEEFWNAGYSKKYPNINYDSYQLAIGSQIEMEHTTNKLISEKIAKDHLAEIPDYYTRLIKLEKN